MTTRDRKVRIYDLHSWTGIALGLFVYVVSFTGCLALFYHEIHSWEDPAKRLTVPDAPVALQPHLDAWVDETAAGHEVTFVLVQYPSTYEPYFFARLNTKDADGHTDSFTRRWDPATGVVLPERGEGLATWLLDFHRDLMWPDELGGRQIGRSIVGVAGIILMLSILTGVITHSKMMRELFTLRYLRSVRLKWQDTHKVIGLWGLPFYAMISFTGAFLGVIALLLPIMAAIVVKGDTDKLLAALGNEPPERTGAATRMITVDEVGAMRHAQTGNAPSGVFITNWGDETAIYQVNYEAASKLVSFDAVTISGVTGQPTTGNAFLEPAVVNRVLSAITPLHYGTYGGIALKVLYLVLGLSLCAVTALGLMMWIERRLHGNEGRKSEAFYRRLSRFTVGVTAGVAVASVALFYHDKLYTGAESARLVWTGWTYFLVWAVVVAYAMWRTNDYRTTRDLTALTGLGLIGLPLLNGLATGDFFLSGLAGANPVTAWVDVSFLVLGAITCTLAAALPSHRPEAVAATTDTTHAHAAPAE